MLKRLWSRFRTEVLSRDIRALGGIMAEVANGTRTVVLWLLGILGSLITAGVIAAVGLGWATSQATVRIETQLESLEGEIDVTFQRQQRQIDRVEMRLDSHIAGDRAGT